MTDIVEVVAGGFQRPTTSPVFVTPTRRLIYQQNNVAIKKSEVGTFFALYPLAAWQKATTLLIATAETNMVPLVFLEAGLSTDAKLTLEAVMYTNNVAPTSTFAFGLYKVEKSEAAENKTEVTFEPVTASSIATITKPAAKTFNKANTTFSAPAAGFYGIGMEVKTEAVDKSFSPTTVSLFASS